MAGYSSEQQGKPPPYTVKVDPGDALELVKTGASLLVLDMARETLLGVDLQMLSVGPLFKGVKMIPPGPHFIYYSPTSRHGTNLHFITGFFIHPNPGDVLVRRWDPGSETLVQLSDPDEESRYQASVRDLAMDRNLGAYDLHRHRTWKRLSSHITPQVIERLEPIGANISVMHEADYADTLPQTAAERRMQQHILECREALLRSGASHEQGLMQNAHGCTDPHDGTVWNKDGDEASRQIDAHSRDMEAISMDTDNNTSACMDMDTREDGNDTSTSGLGEGDGGGKKPSGRCFYTQFPHLVKRHGVSSAALTMLNVDKSLTLEHLIEREYKGSERDFLGELEFSFIAFLMGQSLESFAQWKAMVCLMLSCDEAPLHMYTRLFVEFLEIICFQLHVGLRGAGVTNLDIPYVDNSWVSEDNFLRSRFKEFYELVTEAHPVDGDLLKQTKSLKGILESSLGWSFEKKHGKGKDDNDDDVDDDDEYAPVIVSEAELASFYRDT